MASTIHNLISQGVWQHQPTPGDGHCLLHAVILSWKLQLPGVTVPTYESIKTDIYVETIQNIHRYLPFIEGGKISLLKDLSRYLLQKHYNSPYGDILPFVVANVFSLELIIINENRQGHIEVYNISPVTSVNIMLTIHRHNEHYSGICLNKVVNLTTSVNISPSNKLHHIENRSPTTLFTERPQLNSVITYSAEQLKTLETKYIPIKRTVRKILFTMQLWKPKANTSENNTHKLRNEKRIKLTLIDNSENTVPEASYKPPEQQLPVIIRHRRHPSQIARGVNGSNLIHIHQECWDLPVNKHLFNIGLINARSAKQQDMNADKPTEIHDLIIDQNLDVLVITETWFKGNDLDQACIDAITPNGYDLQHVPRPNKHGGGLAIIYHCSLHVSSLEVSHFESFESFTTNIRHTNTSLCLTAIYRPPQKSQSQFLSDFSDLLEQHSSKQQNSIIMGDFNFRVNSLQHTAGQSFLTMLDSLNFQQLVQEPTHKNGNTLDLVICSTMSALLINVVGIDWSVSSDHGAVLCSVNLPKPVRSRRKISVRKWREIDVGCFNHDIATHSMSNNQSHDSLSKYNLILQQLVEQHAPCKTITITERPSTPWYTCEVRHAKTLCRKYERRWQKTGLTIDYDLYIAQRSNLALVRDRAKSDYIGRKLSEATSSKDTFAVLNTLLHKKAYHPLPNHSNLSELTENFAAYFKDKIDTVRQVFLDTQDPPNIVPSISISSMDTFREVTENEISKMIATSACKSCTIDPVPTWLLKKCPSVVPLLCNIVNDSLKAGEMPSQLKEAHVIPALKKSSLDRNEFKNYRPISNLAYTSKLIERAVSSQLKDYCARNKINICFQSAYREFHSTETALIRVQNDLLKAVDIQGGAVLVLLDLSAAFDTIDHTVLLQTLQHHMGLTGTALAWFNSYLSDRHQSVKIGRTLSRQRQLAYGVPQGSVLGPQLFSIYTSPLHNVIEACNMSYHLYADDTQLYLAFNPKCATSVTNMRQVIANCTSAIGKWMHSHYLKLNNDKTELLVLTRPSLTTSIIPTLEICGTTVNSTACVKDLGVYYDHLLRMDTHVRTVCKKAFYQLHLIRKVRRFISEDTARTFVQANVTSLMDYCNGLLVGLPASLLNLLQRVQNSAARVVKQLPRACHITPVLKDLHWLPVKYRVDYKILLLTFKALHGLAPDYINDLLKPYHPSRTLRSSDDNLLTVPTSRIKSFGGRTFEITAPTLWNNLPFNLRQITSLQVFKKTLKTYLFKEAFATIL